MSAAARMVETAEALSAAWNARALALAEARHLTGTARLELQGEPANVWRVPSADRRSTHLVRVLRHSGELHCDCVAASYGRPCAHAGATLHAEAQRTRALAIRECDAFLSWLKGWEW